MTVKQIGTGITARLVPDKLAILRDDSVEPLVRLEQLFHHINDLAQSIRSRRLEAESESVYRRLLKHAGYPTRAGYYRRRDDKWQRNPQSDTVMLQQLRMLENLTKHFINWVNFVSSPEFGSYDSLTEIKEAETGADSDQHFAATIITNFAYLRLARRSGLHNLQELTATITGYLTTLWIIKRSAEPLWELGNKVRTGGEMGAASRHGTMEDRERKRKQINDMVALGIAEGLTLTKARQRAAKKLRISYSTVRRAQSSH